MWGLAVPERYWLQKVARLTCSKKFVTATCNKAGKFKLQLRCFADMKAQEIHVKSFSWSRSSLFGVRSWFFICYSGLLVHLPQGWICVVVESIKEESVERLFTQKQSMYLYYYSQVVISIPGSVMRSPLGPPSMNSDIIQISVDSTEVLELIVLHSQNESTPQFLVNGMQRLVRKKPT